MCLIFANKENQKVDRRAMVKALKGNPDGTGLLLWDDTQWIVEKHLAPNIDELCDRMDSYSRYAIHYRWSTHGKVSLANCHPFSLGNGWYLMHNGILPFTPSKLDRSDTWQLAQYLKAIGISSMTRRQLKGLLPILREVINGDRILLATNEGKIIRLGKWIEKNEGYYSNGGCLVTPSPISFIPTYSPRLDAWDSWEDDPYVIGNYRWQRRGDK